MKYDVQKNQRAAEDHDLTQKYMAHYLNVIQRTYSRYERGERIILLMSYANCKTSICKV